jgi:hypothetical protein
MLKADFADLDEVLFHSEPRRDMTRARIKGWETRASLYTETTPQESNKLYNEALHTVCHWPAQWIQKNLTKITFVILLTDGGLRKVNCEQHTDHSSYDVTLLFNQHTDHGSYDVTLLFNQHTDHGSYDVTLLFQHQPQGLNKTPTKHRTSAVISRISRRA